jgi:hypothetical protein
MRFKKIFNIFMFAIATAMCFFLIPNAAYAQDVVSIDTPSQAIDPQTIGALEVGLTVLFAYLIRFIPFLKDKGGLVRNIVGGFVVIFGFVAFRLDFLTQGTVEFIFDKFLPNSAYAGFAWEALKFLKRLLQKEQGRE